MEHTVPLTLQWDETFDVGVDTGTPVDDKDYQVPFAFTGKLNKVTVSLKPSQLSAEDQRKLDINSQRDNAASE
jgi:arylsulfatase